MRKIFAYGVIAIVLYEIATIAADGVVNLVCGIEDVVEKKMEERRMRKTEKLKTMQTDTIETYFIN